MWLVPRVLYLTCDELLLLNYVTRAYDLRVTVCLCGGVFFEPSYSMTKLHSVAVTVWHYVRYIARCDGGEQG